MLNENDDFRDLNSELEQLRGSLVELRQLLSARSAREPSLPAALESANKRLHSIKTLVRLLETETTALEARLERAVRETWDHVVERGITERGSISSADSDSKTLTCRIADASPVG